MARIEFDTNSMSMILSQMEEVLETSREEIQKIKEKYREVTTYEDLAKEKNMPKLYSRVVDDHGKVCFALSDLSECAMDIRSMKKALAKSNQTPAMFNSFRSRIDYMLEMVQLDKEVVSSVKDSLDARIRFYSSCMYMSYDKVIGSKS